MLKLSNILQNRPWDNLVLNLTVKKSLFKWSFLLFNALLLPFLVISKTENPTLTILYIIMGLCGYFWFKSYLRSGENWFALTGKPSRSYFSFIYKGMLQINQIYTVFIAAFLVLSISLNVLKLLTGVTRSQKLPDMSDYTFSEILFSSAVAGITEEVWRLSVILLVLGVCQTLLKKMWTKKRVQFGSLLVAILVSSFVFGWLHTFGYSNLSFSLPITLQLGIMGLGFSAVMLITRRLWMAVLFHCCQDVLAMGVQTLRSKSIITGDVSGKELLAQYPHVSVWVYSIGAIIIVSVFASAYLLDHVKATKPIQYD